MSCTQNKMENIEDFLKHSDFHLGRNIFESLRSFGDSIQQIELTSDLSETHSSVLLRSIRVAQELKKRGLGLGDIVLVCAKNHNDVGIPIIASLYIGCAVRTLSTTMTKTEVNNAFGAANASIVFCDPEMSQIFAEVLSERNNKAEIVVFEEKPTSEKFIFFEEFSHSGNEDKFKVTDFDPEKTIAFIISSSGTTGLPKGVCHTHKSYLASQFLFNNEIEKRTSQLLPTPAKVNLGFSTVYWVTGILNLLQSCLFGNTRINSTYPFTVDLFFKAINKYKPSQMILSPVSLCELTKHPNFNDLDMTCVRKMIVGASPIAPSVMEQFEKNTPNAKLLHVYGMTEAGMLSMNNGENPSTCGKILPWIEWKIVNPDTGKRLGPNQIGELRVKCATLFKEYYQNPEATLAAYDADGYYQTGDLLYFDNNYDMFFVDRIKEMMKFRNFQITPAEMEFEIMKLPSVVQVGVVGQPHPEDGEHPIAFVQVLQGSNVTAQQIKNVVKSSLSDLKQLRGGVVFLKELPSTPSGKVNRKYLKQMALTAKGE